MYEHILAITWLLIYISLGMILMRIYMWLRNYKRVKIEIISICGPQFRSSNDDDFEIKERMRKRQPNHKFILVVDCIKQLSSRMDNEWDERIYEVKYI